MGISLSGFLSSGWLNYRRRSIFLGLPPTHSSYLSWFLIFVLCMVYNLHGRYPPSSAYTELQRFRTSLLVARYPRTSVFFCYNSGTTHVRLYTPSALHPSPSRPARTSTIDTHISSYQQHLIIVISFDRQPPLPSSSLFGLEFVYQKFPLHILSKMHARSYRYQLH